MTANNNTIDSAGMQDLNGRFWGVALNPGIGSKNMIGFYLTCFFTIMLATFIPTTQPFLLNEVMRIPATEQGVVSGNLNFWGEIVIILTVGLLGSLSDKIGRRTVTAASFVVMSAGIVLYGLATDTTDLLIARCVYCVGIAGASTMMITIMADYATNQSRGKATGFLGVMNGLGAMVSVLLLVRLPEVFQGRGLDAAAAGFATYSMLSIVTLVAAALLFICLKPGVTGKIGSDKKLLVQMKEGFVAARDPGISLAYAASFVARGNLAVVGTFFTLWASIYGTQVLGMSSAEAITKGGAIVAISYAASLFTAPIFGILTDKVSRVDALSVTMLIAVVGYGGTFFIENPFGVGMIICLIFIGMAEVGCIITSGVLIAQQAPESIRGSAIGVFTFSGAVGILVASLAGGHLFDSWMRSGPFVLFGAAAGFVFIWALVVRNKISVSNSQAAALTNAT